MAGWIARLVGFATARPWLTLLAALVLTVLSAVYAAGHFEMSTDTAELISAKTPWRQDEARFDAAFPQNANQIVVVVDGATPELAQAASQALAQKAAARTDVIAAIRQPDGGAFFEQNGLLFLSRGEVAEATSKLTEAQPVLGPLAADPSLRGVMTAVTTLAQGAQTGQTELGSLQPLLSGLADAGERAADNRPVSFSWMRLMGGQGGSTLAPLRRIVLVRARPDFGALEPGADAEAALRLAARELKLDPAHGVRVRLTGELPLSDEEFSSLEDNAGVVTFAMIGGALLMLWLATRSVLMPAAILATTIAGLIVTSALGLAIVGRFNLISVAFIPLFIGLGVDFGIQLMVRFRAERLADPDTLLALRRAAAGIGGALTVAAAAIALGFFAFLPTSYVGVAELGAIAGVGMVIALLLTATLLPALIVLLKPRLQDLSVGWAVLAPLDRALVERRKLVLGGFALSVVISIALLPFLKFDFNPLHLRNPKGEAVSTIADLAKDPDRSPNVIDVLTPSLPAADQLAARLGRLPEVGQTVTLASFVPDDQPAKLALIQDASLLLDVAVNPLITSPPPTAPETVQAMTAAAAELRKAAGDRADPAAVQARRLAAALERLLAGPPVRREAYEQALTQPLGTLLTQVRNMLAAQPVSLDTLPPDLKREWMAPDGRARVQVTPRPGRDDNPSLVRFARAVRAVAPHASGGPISIQEAARTIAGAFIQAGVLSLIAVAALLFLRLRSLKEVAFTLAPVVLSGFLTLATCVVIGQSINFANIIAFPLLFGVGVAFHIYFVMAWRDGEANLLQSSLTRAILFSAFTTGLAFGALWLSHHPGTASMGKILLISIVWTLICALLFEPALLGPVRASSPPSS